MKNFLVLLLVITMGSCLSYRELPVEYDYSYKGKFNKYRTYDFFSLNEFHGDDTLEIRGAIEKHMKFLGYKRKKRKPDLLLNYAIYQDSMRFKGYIQPDITDWVDNPSSDYKYQQLNIDLTRGTLLIQVYDRRLNSSIWQGYATDQFKQINFHNYKEINNAVRSILNSYQFFAKDFIADQLEKSNNQ